MAATLDVLIKRALTHAFTYNVIYRGKFLALLGDGDRRRRIKTHVVFSRGRDGNTVLAFHFYSHSYIHVGSFWLVGSS